MKVAIIYQRLLDYDGKEQSTGGIQTYLLHLGALCSKMGWNPVLFQFANRPFRRTINALEIVGVPVAGINRSHLLAPLMFKSKKLELLMAAKREINVTKDIIIFGADWCSVKTDNRRCIAIQHGISWDLPTRYMTNRKVFESGWGATMGKWFFIRSATRDFENCQNRVCVDYNFLNWYRTTSGVATKGKIWVIPNFASSIASPEQITVRRRTTDNVRILFARRFTSYRGVHIMAETAKEILQRYDKVSFTFAGEGPEEIWLKEQFFEEKRVTFTKYLPHEVLDIHLVHDIAVIPSVASEGTSLSVAEAMGAGCVVVAAAVGGITNMIINGYNGILVMPDVSSLTAGLELVLKNADLRIHLMKRAYETAKEAFVLEIWEERWQKVLLEVAGH
ncbi:MAG: glycosyltransferase family 4 protein [Candidatus Scalindua sp.]|nr:glycosyltransferase family 4 protein [Candidatus Scalindua sp.]MDR4503333.1 glycosyltransferase family 4 protein [Candidatus Scalindua sp.]